ncbi:sugar ABC transporter substrate-binding protein [Kitasatospora sp. NPDC127111]|uniref:sugar ABC transporter substrate-binding protein n=1 Tax=Kitasatospora sp. NPDC127111 TaxID=3345363 RepID=UPI00363F6514
MNRPMRRAATGTAALSLALALAACGQTDGTQTPAADGAAKTIGLLLPENASSTRYEAFDKPLIESTVTGLCPKCVIDYANADGNEATQKRQFDDLLAKGVKVILLDPVNAKSTAPWVEAAAAKGAKVVAYDRLAEGKVAAYVSFDNGRTGELQGQALLDALGPKAAAANVVMINGAESDPNAGMFKAGAHRALDGKVKKIAYEQSGEWKPEVATAKMNEAIKSLGKDGIQAVYAANDGMAASVIEALKAAGIKNVPVGGQDASIDAVRRVLTGEQTYTIYKPYKPEAEAAGTIAVQLVEGMDISSVASAITESGGVRIPSLLLTPIVVTKAKVQVTVVGGGLYKAADLCTPQVADACAAAGVK